MPHNRKECFPTSSKYEVSLVQNSVVAEISLERLRVHKYYCSRCILHPAGGCVWSSHILGSKCFQISLQHESEEKNCSVSHLCLSALHVQTLFRAHFLISLHLLFS